MSYLLTIPAAMALVGLTGLIGAFWVGRDLGRVDATAGVLLVVYTVVIGALVGFGARESTLPGVPEFALVVPWIAGASLIAGVIAGATRRG